MCNQSRKQYFINFQSKDKHTQAVNTQFLKVYLTQATFHAMCVIVTKEQLCKITKTSNRLSSSERERQCFLVPNSLF